MSGVPSSLEYAVYGVLCAAKLETGPQGARRAYRVWERLDASQEDVDRALARLMERGWVRESDPIPGMSFYVHFEKSL